MMAMPCLQNLPNQHHQHQHGYISRRSNQPHSLLPRNILLQSLRSAKGESEKSTKSNITRRFSSSFDYRHTDRYYHSAPSANCEMQSPLSTKTRSRRSYSLAKRPSNTTSSDQDEELEDFVRSFNLRQTPGFQSKMINEEESSDVIYGPSLDISASSFYRSKKALVHFQNLRGVHDSLSQSIISSTILPPLSSSLEQQQQQQQSITTASQATGVLSASKDQLPRASNSDISASSNSSLLSTSQSRGSPLGRLYQPRAPSPLHTEQSPLPTTGSIPVRIPERKHQHTDNNMADTTSSNEHHHDLYPPFMQRNKGFSDDDNNLSTPIKDTSQSSHEPHQQQKQLPKDMPKYRQFRRSTQLSINTESTSSSSGGFEREEDEQPNSAAAQDEDDDSLVFKMSELGIHEHHSK
ncbi:hypothetical protein BDB00DRAFT_599567 [Zychaea mexicana]|uniref:uncharacterized protein n=1 Tax=Zychaea mexicana TaxID=64656 RepID=UPI0022FF4077|nr:uncharacterized protein BDB00DRAFT_599567 [Zychaea mexicana]KAI9489767.1 hypothetical protein BDB00DRAFT_599567 [Zychaea mexicana]